MAHAITRPSTFVATRRPSTFDWLFNLRPGALTVFYALLSYAVLIALTLSTLVLASNVVYEQVDLRLRSSSIASAGFVGQTLQARAGVVAAFGNRPSLVSLMNNGHLNATDEAAVQAQLVQLQAAVDGAYSAWITYPDGTQAASSTNPELR